VYGKKSDLAERNENTDFYPNSWNWSRNTQNKQACLYTLYSCLTKFGTHYIKVQVYIYILNAGQHQNNCFYKKILVNLIVTGNLWSCTCKQDCILLAKTASNYYNVHVSYYLFIEALENLLDFSCHLLVHNVILCGMEWYHMGLDFLVLKKTFIKSSLLLKLISFKICFMKKGSNNNNKLVWILKSPWMLIVSDVTS